MTIIRKNAGFILLTLIVASLMAVAPSFAGMGGGSDRGSGSGGDSGSGMGSPTAGGSDRQDMDSRSGSANMDISAMSEIVTGGLGSGNMTMEIRPVRYSDGRLEVKYYANTHTVSLGKYDLMELSTMEVNGKVYHPVKADRMRGHHAGGKIVFEIPERPDRFRMVIQGLPGVEKRLYEWY